MKRVVVTGMSGLSPIGQDWPTVRANLARGQTGICSIPDWHQFDGLLTQIGAPVPDFECPPHYTRKSTRSMGRVSMLATRSAEVALEAAGLVDDPLLQSGSVGVAYGSCTGSTDAAADFLKMLTSKSTAGINATTYLRMMGHTTPVNIGVFFGLRGRVYTTSSACTSGSQAIGCSFEAIRDGAQTVMIAGGAEELCPTEAAVFDALYATSTRNDEPGKTPRPFDRDRDGLVVGEGAGTLILEELEHARARGATIHAEVVGYGTNTDGRHVTQPDTPTMRVAMDLAMEGAGIEDNAIGYVSAHATATERGDVAEAQAMQEAFTRSPPVSAFKSYTGHTLGACGSLEAWVAIESMNSGWFHGSVNLDTLDPACEGVDHIVGAAGRDIDCEYVMTNNFAFGGINTSLVFRRWAA